MKVGVVDIGTNSMRLLITTETQEEGRWVEVTGLGRGVEEAGALSEEAMTATLSALEGFGRRMDEAGVERRMAIATSASRDAANREDFFDRAGAALGVRPCLITGRREGRYAYRGALSDLDPSGPVLVTDIGGGSTEFVTAEQSLSVDMGTVRLGDRTLPVRPPRDGDIETAREMLESMFSDVDVGEVWTHVGVAGTWTSVAAIANRLERIGDPLHGSVLGLIDVRDLIVRLSALSLEETRAIPGLDPRRAPVILPGALIAEAVMARLGVTDTLISEKDTLDGVALELIGIR